MVLQLRLLHLECGMPLPTTSLAVTPVGFGVSLLGLHQHQQQQQQQPNNDSNDEYTLHHSSPCLDSTKLSCIPGGQARAVTLSDTHHSSGETIATTMGCNETPQSQGPVPPSVANGCIRLSRKHVSHLNKLANTRTTSLVDDPQRPGPLLASKEASRSTVSDGSALCDWGYASASSAATTCASLSEDSTPHVQAGFVLLSK